MFYAEVDENFNWIQYDAGEPVSERLAIPTATFDGTNICLVGVFYRGDFYYIPFGQTAITDESIVASGRGPTYLGGYKGDRIAILIEEDYIPASDTCLDHVHVFKNGLLLGNLELSASVMAAIVVSNCIFLLANYTAGYKAILYKIALDTLAVEIAAYGIGYDNAGPISQAVFDPSVQLQSDGTSLFCSIIGWDALNSFVHYCGSIPPDIQALICDPPQLQVDQITCSKPLLTLSTSAPQDSASRLHFRIQSFADAAGTQQIDSVDSASNPGAFQFSPDNGTAWLAFPPDGLHPNRYGALVRARLSVGPRQKVWLKASVGAAG